MPAVTYFVAGKASDETFAKAEHLAEMLMKALPSGECGSPWELAQLSL